MNVSIVIHSLHTSFPVTILGMHLIGWSVATELCHQVARQQANIVVQQTSHCTESAARSLEMSAKMD